VIAHEIRRRLLPNYEAALHAAWDEKHPREHVRRLRVLGRRRADHLARRAPGHDRPHRRPPGRPTHLHPVRRTVDPLRLARHRRRRRPLGRRQRRPWPRHPRAPAARVHLANRVRQRPRAALLPPPRHPRRPGRRLRPLLPHPTPARSSTSTAGPPPPCHPARSPRPARETAPPHRKGSPSCS
jgi:hypothetical protein